MATSNTITTSTSSRHKKSRSNRSDKHSSSRKRRKSSPKDEGSKPNKYKTLSQLAKLVHSGKLKIPCSLVEYVDDHASLIDQLFTILTMEDIEGMLPDVLKGIKMKKIKHLCNVQLSKMSPDELHRALTEDPTTTTNSTTEGQSTNESAPVVSDISDAEMETTSGTNGASSLNVGVVNEEDEIEVNVTCSDLFNSQTEEEEEGEIKDDETYSTGSFQQTNTDTVNNSVLIDTTSTVGRIGRALSVEDEKRWSQDVPEEARLMEMRLRERLLEMQVKRLTSNKEPVKEKQVQEQQDCISSYSDHSDSDHSDSVSEAESSNEEPGELAELDLRQRALESLLARRKEKLKI